MDLFTIHYESVFTIICFITSIIVVMYAQFKINFTYSRYRKVNNKCGLSGMEVARKILDENGLSKIYIVETRGKLTDHYDPTRKVIKLSNDIFNGETILAASVAAHECGHAIQDKENYSFMKIRSALVPIVNLVSYLGYFGIIVGLLAGISGYFMIGIITLLVTIVFQLVTLPVELDASARATEELVRLNIIDEFEKEDVKSVLSAAAMTYVASLISTLLNLLRLIMMFTDRD